MRFDEFSALCGRTVAITPDLWAMAHLLGRARTHTNLSRRAKHDRGAAGNERVDLWGAFGELLAYRILERHDAPPKVLAGVRERLFHPAGGAAMPGADIALEDGGVDVKTQTLMDGYRYLAINAEKHAALAGECRAYMVILAPKYGKYALVSRPIPHADVEGWPVASLGPEPSRNLPLSEVFPRYCAGLLPPDFTFERLRAGVHAETDVRRIAAQPGCLTRLCEVIPSLRDFALGA